MKFLLLLLALLPLLAFAFIPTTLPWWHPHVYPLLSNNISAPDGHPPINYSVQSYDPGHVNCDGGLLENAYLPYGHPNLDSYYLIAPLPTPVTNITAFHYHPNADDYYNNNISVPSNHPLIQPLIFPFLPVGHCNVDMFLQDPADNPLPFWHPKLELLFTRRPAINFTALVPTYHTNLSKAYQRNRTALPSGHPDVSQIFQGVLPALHPNLDTLLANPGSYPLPSWHPPLNNYMSYSTTPFLTTPTINVQNSHPNIDQAWAANARLPSGHPDLDSLFAGYLPIGHPDLDMLVSAATYKPIPYSYHPTLESMIQRRSIFSPGLILSIIMFAWFFAAVCTRFTYKLIKFRKHRQVAKMIEMKKAAKKKPEKGHRPQSSFAVFPQNPLHSLHYPTPVPPSTAAASSINYPTPVPPSAAASPLDFPTPVPPSAAPDQHSTQVASPRSSVVASPRSSVVSQKALKWVSPSSVITEDDRKSEVGSSHGSQPGSTLSSPKIEVAFWQSGESTPNYAISVVPDLQDNWQEYFTDDEIPYYHNAVTGETTWEKPVKPLPIPQNSLNTFGYRKYRGQSRWGPFKPEGLLPPLDLSLHLIQQRHSRHRGASFYEETDIVASQHTTKLPASSDCLPTMLSSPSSTSNLLPAVPEQTHPRSRTRGPSVYKEARKMMRKKNNKLISCWKALSSTRIANTQWTTGNMFFVGIFMLLNLASILLSPTYPLDLAFGSLAAANTMILVIPATKNNILTWFLGIPFDHVVLYHRFLSRFAIFVGSVHFFFYITRLSSNWTDMTYMTGFIAILIGYLITITSLDWVRRHKFAVFFWTHYSFIAYFVLVYFHSSLARPFLLTGIALYALDRILRILWVWIPRRTIVFRNRSESIAQVCFPKNPFARCTRMHRVGQYFFVNFPALSLTEWHPFSVSSGPQDDHVELHIRALGDHTREIVEFSKRCVAEHKLPWIRMDGPYGSQGFNYRRYQVLILVGGGVGITPVIGLLKDIYLSDNSEVGRHSMESVYVVWVMPDGKEAEVFLDIFQQCMRVADASNTLPTLTTYIYCTRAKPGSVAPPLMAGRPDFPKLLDIASPPDKDSTLVFTCGPSTLVNHLWDECTQRTTTSHRVDFHHDIFEF